VIVNYDDINMSDGPATSDVEVSLVLNTADAWNPVSAWTDEKWHVPTNWHIRLGAWESEPPAESEYDTDDMLVRYFWDYASGPTARSGFTNLTSASVPVMRVHQYGTPGDEFMVLSQIVMPYEYPSDRTDMADVAYGALDTLDFYIDSAFTAAINHPDTIWVYGLSMKSESDPNWLNVARVLDEHFPKLTAEYRKIAFSPEHPFWLGLRCELESLRRTRGFNMDIRL